MKFQNWILNYEYNKKIKQTKFLKRNNTKQSIFECVKILYPSNFNITNYNRKPLAVFNPGATIYDSKLILFPRLIFDYYHYVSSIGYVEIPLGNFPNDIKTPLDTKIIRYPTSIFDIWGNEDSRVYKNWLLWVQLGKNKETNFAGGTIDFKKQNIINEIKFSFKRNHHLLENEEIGRDFAILNYSHMLCRPERNIKYCGITTWDINKQCGYLNWNDLRFLLKAEDWEEKVGWSTNSLEIANDLNIVGWHAINRKDYRYYNGLAIIDNDGELCGISDYVLYPGGIEQTYGDRTGVVFGCGLLVIDKSLYWIGGISDYAIGIFRCPFNTIMDNIHFE